MTFTAGLTIPPDELREALRRLLPAYMVPRRIIEIVPCRSASTEKLTGPHSRGIWIAAIHRVGRSRRDAASAYRLASLAATDSLGSNSSSVSLPMCPPA